MSIFTLSCNKNFHYEIIQASPDSERLFTYVERVEPFYSVYSDSNSVVNAAIDVWNNAAGRELITRNTGGFPITINWVSDLIDLNNPNGILEQGTSALSYRGLEDCKIDMLSCGQGNCYLELEVMIHELGHCIGFAHSINPNSIMYRTIIPDQNITTAIIDIINQEPLSL